MISRRKLLGMSVAAAVIAPRAAAGQAARKTPRIGMLFAGAPPSRQQPSPLVEAFRKGLRDLGYVEGQSLVIEYRWAEGRDERLAELARELVGLDAAVIVTAGTLAVKATRGVTSTTPIVMAFAGDPVGIGVVSSLAHPGTNVTGLSLLDSELDGKRIQLLKETTPGLTRVGMLWSANDPGMTLAFKRVDAAARSLGLALENLAVRKPTDFPRALKAANERKVQALIVTVQAFTLRHRAQVLELAAKLRLPAMYTLRSFADAGGLMAYGPSLPDLFRRAAIYVDKILKGAKPADLPVEQPTTFELVINMKTAKALGLTIPPSLLLRADQVIQ